MVTKRREIPPGFVAAGQFDYPGHQHKAEQEPTEKKMRLGSDTRFGSRGWKQAQRGEEDAQESGLQQKVVPLKVHKHLPRNAQRKVGSPKSYKTERWGNACDEQQAQENACATQ